MDSKRKPFHVEFAEQVVAALEAGTAPWQKPWHPGESQAPHNPVSGTKYRGVNRLRLDPVFTGFDDPRWMTVKQANAAGYSVKKGSHGTPVIFYQWTHEIDRIGEDGKPLVGADGKKLKHIIERDKPILRFASVFNGEQIEGLPPLRLTDQNHSYAWDPVEKAEEILTASGADIHHDQSGRAFYSPAGDSIHLPPKANFEDAGKYYGTAIHELGHWTGHASRMNRDFGGGFGSESYAREELRAEIASWMLAQDTGIPHDPGQHAAYVKSWIEDLKENALEIQRACRDAEQIKEYVMGLEREKKLEQAQSVSLGEEKAATVVNIEPDIIPVDLSDTRALSGWIREQYQGMTVEIADDGTVQKFTRSGLNASVKRRGEEQRQMYAGLDDLVRNAVYSDFEKADARHAGKVAGQNVYYAAAGIEGKLFAVRIKIDMPVLEEGLAAYKDHKISEIEIAPSLYDIRSASPNIQNEDAIVKDPGVIPSVRAGILAGSAGEELTPSIAAPQQQPTAILKISLAVLKKYVNPLILQDGILSKDTVSEVKTVLAVPYSEKNQAKKLGARWDQANRVWFAPPGADLAAFAKWMPRKDVQHGADTPVLSAAGELALAIQALGGDLQGKMPVMDKKIHRIPVLNRKPGNKDFAYCAYDDAFPAGWMQNHAENQKAHWQYSGHQLTDEQKTALKAQAEQARLERERERTAQRQVVAEACAGYFAKSHHASPHHPYLARKGIPPSGAKITELSQEQVVPLMNNRGEIRSLQYIDADGSKKFQTGAEKSGNFFVIGSTVEDLGKHGHVLIAEGFATAASLHLATEKPVVVAFDAGNLLPAAKNVRALLPEAELTICADNDHSHKLPDGKFYNVGLDKGKIAADQVKGRLAVPALTLDDKKNGLKDFNDIHVKHGLAALKSQMEKTLAETRQAETGLGR